MKKYLPGILFLLAMSCSILLFVKVESASGSEILALLAAVALYVVVALVLTLIMNRNSSDKE